MAKKKNQVESGPDPKLVNLLDHYNKGREDMDTRRTRKNGWNDVINAYMGKLPKNWPFLAQTTDPRIRTTILEKTARLLNAKLQGRLVPREGGDIVKARINNAILDFQWDYATEGGPMIEKVAFTDQIARLYGAAFVYVYWDNKKNTNEIKICDPRDIFWDFASTHARNAKWVQYREYTTLKSLEDRGYDLTAVHIKMQSGAYQNERRNEYESQVKINRGLEDRVGTDLSNPVVEAVTEFTPTTKCLFLPKYGEIVHDGKNPYKHGKIPFSQLRYYPLGDDIYGESEVESVLPLARAINSTLCAFLEQTMLTMRPPLKVSSSGVRIETIEYGPGARWIMQNPDQVQEMQFSQQFIANFNATYPALVAAFNTAMGSESLGTSNIKGTFTDKTATEVKQLSAQQNTRDQYNQLYLSEFLQDIMLMWLSNNKQYLLDDPEKHYHVLKIIGKDKIQELQALKLDDTEIPDEALQTISDTVVAHPEGVTDQMLSEIVNDVSIPTNPVVTNPLEENPENYTVKNKLDVKKNGEEADLYIERDDFEGEFDYVPDVQSMAAGAGQMQQDARERFMERILNPQVQTMLQMQGEAVNIKDLLVSDAEHAGYRDAEGLFKPIEQGGQGALGASPMAPGPTGAQGIQGIPPSLPPQPVPGGIPQPQGLPNPGEINPGLYQ